MVKKSFSSSSGFKIGIGAVAVALVLLVTWPMIFPSAIAPAVFSRTVVDGKLGFTLNNDKISYALYQTTDIEEWSDFVLIERGTDLDSFTEADLTDANDAKGTLYAIMLNATFDALDSDDDIDDDKGGLQPYNNTWFRVYEGQANTFTLYRTPSSAGLALLNKDSLAALSVNLTKQDVNWWGTGASTGNMTAIVGINATEGDNVGFMGFRDYTTGDDAQLYMVFNFNNTAVENNDLSIIGSSSWKRLTSKYNTTAIAFVADSLTQTAYTFEIDWDDDVTSSIICTTAELIWNPQNVNAPLAAIA